jgi:hypothetical protein
MRSLLAVLLLTLTACGEIPCPEHSSEVDAGGVYTCECDRCYGVTDAGACEWDHSWDIVCLKSFRP